MSRNSVAGPFDSLRGLSTVGVVSLVALVVLSATLLQSETWDLLVISWAAFAAMAGAGVLAVYTHREHAQSLVWGYGLASGAMITSAAVFLVPQAIGVSGGTPQYGGFGIALGLVVGFGSHTIGHRLAHMDLPLDRTVAELSAHALSAGAIIGLIYGNMDVGLTLGLAIISHKGPAGYAAANRLARNGRGWSVLLLPAAGVGIAAILSSLVAIPASGAVRGVVFGFAAGVFLHVAMDFLPRCEIGSEIHDVLKVEGDAHQLLDRLRLHAVASTALGGFAVFVAWVFVA
ncbi:zinc transporter, ZIP family [Halogranum gelatinilyticum]|uniref:Zinc transporter, ZIP family n=1 Tax=Halogranum gelatinilyticum TaxID=660521 RepID=A0A1G9UJI4_9EURY|nr:ZIP family metal transporter [Halogranum gelatinilyticum]SDM60071.1 zinc transporter, ZIP family [Halogranum gelatinilyticum]